MSLATIILAAGMGKRMNDPTKPKVLFEIHGKPMLEYVILRAIEIGSDKIVIIVGFQREQVIAFVREKFSHVANIEFAVQEQQLGTGHAVAQAEGVLQDFKGNIIILSGDVPLLRTKTLERFRDYHVSKWNIASLISCNLDDPFGYGRIVRNRDSEFVFIQEQKDANDTELTIMEINSWIYMTEGMKLFEALGKIGNHNAWGEYYLTDIFRLFTRSGNSIGAYTIENPLEISGANTIEQLKELELLAAI